MHPSTATTYENIGKVYHELSNHQEAFDYHHKAYKIRKEILGMDHIDTANSLDNIGLCFLSNSSYN